MTIQVDNRHPHEAYSERVKSQNEEFLASIFTGAPSGSYTTLFTIEAETKATGTEFLQTTENGLHRLTERAKSMRLLQRNTYFRPSVLAAPLTQGKRGSEEDAIGASVLWADLDIYHFGVTCEDAMARVTDGTLVPIPSCAVFSGGGLQVYWFLDAFCTDKVALKERNKWIASQLVSLGADNVCDLARVLRLPGTLNHKYSPPSEARVLLLDLEQKRYSLNDFKVLPQKPQHQRTEKQSYPKNANAYVQAAVDGELDRLQDAIPEVNRNSTLNRIAFSLQQVADMAGLSDAEEEDIFNQVRDVAYGIGLKETEIERTIESARNGAYSKPREVYEEGNDMGNDEVKEEPKKEEPKSNGRFTPTISSFRDLQTKKFVPMKWVIPDILPEGLYLLAGKSKMGKSWMLLGLAVAVAAGGLALGQKRVEQGDVLYLALEDSERRLQSRLETILPPGTKLPPNMEYATTWNKFDADGLIAIEQWIESHPKARLIIVDTWAKVKPDSRKKNAYDADYDVMTPLWHLANKHCVCILLTLHLRKAGATDALDEINATTGAAGAADGTLILKRDRGTADATLFGTGRDLNEFDLALSFNDGIWKLIGSAEDCRISKERRAVLDAVESGCTAVRDIADAIGRKVDASLRMLLSRMVHDGELRSISKGTYTIPNGK